MRNSSYYVTFTLITLSICLLWPVAVQAQSELTGNAVSVENSTALLLPLELSLVSEPLAITIFDDYGVVDTVEVINEFGLPPYSIVHADLRGNQLPVFGIAFTTMSNTFEVVIAIKTEEGESDQDPPPIETEQVGKDRETKVATLVGGTVTNTEIKTPTGSTDIDVTKDGTPPIYVTVGGPGKSGQKLEAWKTHLSKMKDLADGKATYKGGAKDGQTVPAGTIEVYLEKGTPQDVIDAATAKFGADHVHEFER